MKKFYGWFPIIFLLVQPEISIGQTPGTKKWEFLTGNYIYYSSPSIGSDGTIYIGSYDNKLYAIRQDGSKKWEFLTGGYIYSSPAIGIDGMIYVGSYDKKLYAIKPDGSKKWEYLTGGYIYSSPAIGIDGTVYVGSNDYKLYAISSNGSKKWEFSSGSSMYSSPSIGSDGTIYIGSYNNKLYAINPDGTKKWEFLTGNSIYSSPSVGSDGTIYVGSYDYKLYAINPDGTKKWEFLTGNNIRYSSPAIGIDGTIYVGSYDKKLYAIKSDGTKKWEFLTGNYIYSSPAIGSDGTVYVGSYDNKLYAINSDGTKKWEFSTGNFIYSSPAIGSDGTIYVGSYDNKLYALYSESKGLNSGPWPKFHKNSSNTGSSAEMTCSDKFVASFRDNNQTLPFVLNFSCLNEKIDITDVVLDNSQFKLMSGLPVVKENSKNSFTLSFTLSNPVTNLNKLNYQVTYLLNGIFKVYSDSLKLATIIENNSELSIVGKKAINAYNAAGDTAVISRFSNQGVIYRLLGYPVLAKACFNEAVAMALPQRFGYTGIKMNQGVTESDLKKSTDATAIYDKAYSDVSASKDVSILAPQITYNKAWELYNKNDCAGAEPLALQTLNHAKANEWLKAKAAVLLGAIKYCKGDTPGALQSFQTAYGLDLNGPIGAMARENMQLINPAIEIDMEDKLLVYPQPALDFFVIECKGIFEKEVTIEMTDMLGKTVYTRKISPSGNNLLHSIDVNGFSPGMYTLTLKGAAMKEVRKVLVQ